MVRWILVLVCVVVGLNAAYMEEARWAKGETFLTFLEKNQLPLAIYYDLDKEDQELAAEILSDVRYQILKDDDGGLKQVLIPIGEELQIHLVKNDKSGQFEFRTTPISYKEEQLSVTLSISQSPYQDIIDATNSYPLANEFVNAFQNSVNFRYLQKGDNLVIFYKQRTRLGERYGNPVIEAAMVEIRGQKNYIFLYDKNRYFDVKGKEVEGFFLGRPVSYSRVSSSFTYKRWHPVLHRYRAHLGIDYAASSGTPIHAAGDGKLLFVGNKGGYGKTIILRHGNGYKTLYAHMSGYRKGIKAGKFVKKGQVIGYVGNTGISTGPHLHFGLYKNDRAINPNSVVKITKGALTGQKRKEFMAYVDDYKIKFETALVERKSPVKEKSFERMASLRPEAEALATN